MNEMTDRARAAWAALEGAEYEMQRRNYAASGMTPKEFELEVRDFLVGRALRMADSILERIARERGVE